MIVNHDNHVDFSEFEEQKEMEEIDSLYIRDNRKIMFNDKTMQTYKTMRFRKMDPIFLRDLNENECFRFYDQWNPYTGERLGPDPYGPLCFHPDSLIKWFYENRLNDLWVSETQQNGIMYQGYYDVAVGAGFDIYIHSRGFNPEKYLFRLPVSDCYCESDTESQMVVTMGPILTDNEVKEIDNIAQSKWNSYYSDNYNTTRPSLFTIKQLYDFAISKKPPILPPDHLTPLEINEFYNKANRLAVDKLRKMKG